MLEHERAGMPPLLDFKYETLLDARGFEHPANCALLRINESLYETFASPWVRAFASPWTAEMLEWLHPMRASRYLCSESFNPWMHGVAVLADAVADNRQPLPHDNPFLEREREALEAMGAPLETARKARDATSEQAFKLLYGDRDYWPGDDD